MEQFTLATLHLATPQQVYNQAVQHLLTQNQKSINNNLSCMYRGNNNLQCAGGCFISDSEYAAFADDVEFQTWDFVTCHAEYVNAHIHDKLILDLQNIHDDCDVKLWPGALIDLGDFWSLDTSIVGEYKESLQGR